MNLQAGPLSFTVWSPKNSARRLAVLIEVDRIQSMSWTFLFFNLNLKVLEEDTWKHASDTIGIQLERATKHRAPFRMT